MMDRALSEGPQVVTRQGKRTVGFVPVDEWERTATQQGSLAAFFAAAPLHGSHLQTRRARDLPRDFRL